MKYNKELYTDSGIYAGCGDDAENHTEKIVKCRKSQECINCKEEIQAGEKALYETGFMYAEPISAYTCLECVEKWLEESGQVESEESEG